MTVARNVVRMYGGFSSAVSQLQSLLLLAIRLYWGFQFAQDGWGKLTHFSERRPRGVKERY